MQVGNDTIDNGVLALTPIAHTQAVSRNPKGARPGQEVGGGGGEASTRRAP